MKVGVNCGHTISGAGYGAVGVIRESNHTRLVGYSLMEKLKAAGSNVVDCTVDEAAAQAEYLAAAVALANKEELDWFISIHFNASAAHTGQGTEVYTYEGRQHPEALAICANIAALGFKNRGVKDGSGLYVIRRTKAKAMLIEVCFCDNEQDAAVYKEAGGADAVAEAILNGLQNYAAAPGPHDGETSIMGKSQAEAGQLTAYLQANNPEGAPFMPLAGIFLEEGEKEGVRGDIAFCQACKETGFFRFGGEVHPEQNNYAGLGATGGAPGLSFPDSRTGIRAQIQHLKAYAACEPLHQECVDPRYKYVKKGCAPTVEQLGGKWAVPGYSGYHSLEEARAAKDSYGDHIVKMLKEALQVEKEPENGEDIAPEGKLWVVQLGAYKSRKNAEAFIKRLDAMGVVSVLKQYFTTK